MSSAAKVVVLLGILAFSHAAFGQKSSSSHDENRPLSNEEIARLMAKYRDYMNKMDLNHNGIIDPEEAADPRAKALLEKMFGRIGIPPRYPIAVSELLRGYENYYRTRGTTPSGGPTGPSSVPGGLSSTMGFISPPSMGFGGPTTSVSYSSFSSPPMGKPVTVPLSAPPTRSASPTLVPPPKTTVAAPVPSPSPLAPPTVEAKPVPRKPARFLTPRERLPNGLPDWFLEKDVNGDGQVTMAEFTANWTPDKVAEFARYDLNHDGIITAAECLKVERGRAGSR